ncbi:Uncharacterised protein [Mycobacteroides abscessus subsp. abscessus]|nr:Uncharacterised protein [Mycobacteroides abscessus subsp. abscessus]
MGDEFALTRPTGQRLQDRTALQVADPGDVPGVKGMTVHVDGDNAGAVVIAVADARHGDRLRLRDRSAAGETRRRGNNTMLASTHRAVAATRMR